MTRNMKLIKRLILLGNGTYILWILYNAVGSGFAGTAVEVIAYSGLIVLLALNSWFLLSKSKH